VDNFLLAFDTNFVHRSLNKQADTLALVASNFKTPMFPNMKFEVEVRHRPSIPNNIKHWHLFKDDEEIQIFLKIIEEFSNISIDQDDENGEAEIHVVEVLQDTIVGHKIIKLKRLFH
jgi:hypothetical protein